ncbi:unnamed protein product [Ixodes pacificus]
MQRFSDQVLLWELVSVTYRMKGTKQSLLTCARLYFKNMKQIEVCGTLSSYTILRITCTVLDNGCRRASGCVLGHARELPSVFSGPEVFTSNRNTCQALVRSLQNTRPYFFSVVSLLYVFGYLGSTIFFSDSVYLFC